MGVEAGWLSCRDALPRGGGGGAYIQPRGLQPPPQPLSCRPARSLTLAHSHALALTQTQDDNLWRETSAEKRALERMEWDMINDVRQAAEVHREVRGGVALYS